MGTAAPAAAPGTISIPTVPGPDGGAPLDARDAEAAITVDDCLASCRALQTANTALLVELYNATGNVVHYSYTIRWDAAALALTADEIAVHEPAAAIVASWAPPPSVDDLLMAPDDASNDSLVYGVSGLPDLVRLNAAMASVVSQYALLTTPVGDSPRAVAACRTVVRSYAALHDQLTRLWVRVQGKPSRLPAIRARLAELNAGDVLVVAQVLGLAARPVGGGAVVAAAPATAAAARGHNGSAADARAPPPPPPPPGHDSNGVVYAGKKRSAAAATLPPPRGAGRSEHVRGGGAGGGADHTASAPTTAAAALAAMEVVKARNTDMIAHIRRLPDVSRNTYALVWDAATGALVATATARTYPIASVLDRWRLPRKLTAVYDRLPLLPVGLADVSTLNEAMVGIAREYCVSGETPQAQATRATMLSNYRLVEEELARLAALLTDGSDARTRINATLARINTQLAAVMATTGARPGGGSAPLGGGGGGGGGGSSGSGGTGSGGGGGAVGGGGGGGRGGGGVGPRPPDHVRHPEARHDRTAQLCVEDDLGASRWIEDHRLAAVPIAVRVAVGVEAEARARPDLEQRDRPVDQRQGRQEGRAAERLVGLDAALRALRDHRIRVLRQPRTPARVARFRSAQEPRHGEDKRRLPMRLGDAREDAQHLVVRRHTSRPFGVAVGPAGRLVPREPGVPCLDSVEGCRIRPAHRPIVGHRRRPPCRARSRDARPAPAQRRVEWKAAEGTR